MAVPANKSNNVTKNRFINVEQNLVTRWRTNNNNIYYLKYRSCLRMCAHGKQTNVHQHRHRQSQPEQFT